MLIVDFVGVVRGFRGLTEGGEKNTQDRVFDTEYDRAKAQRKRSHVAPGKLEAPLLPDLFK